MNQSTNTRSRSFYAERNKIPLRLRLLRWYIKTLIYTRPSKATKFLVKLFTTPRAQRKSNREHLNGPFTADGIEEFVEFEQDTIYLYYEGKPTVLLVPGWDSSPFQYERIITELRNNQMNFLYFDLPGQGKSTGKANDVVKTSRLVTMVLQRFPTIRVILGHSFGAAASYLALFNLQENPAFTSQITQLITIGLPTDHDSVVNPMIQLLDLPKRIHRPFIDGISSYAGMNFLDLDLDMMPINQDIDVHLFHDENDKTFPVDNAIRMKDIYTIHISKGLGHIRILKDELVVKEIMDTILSKNGHTIENPISEY